MVSQGARRKSSAKLPLLSEEQTSKLLPKGVESTSVVKESVNSNMNELAKSTKVESDSSEDEDSDMDADSDLADETNFLRRPTYTFRDEIEAPDTKSDIKNVSISQPPRLNQVMPDHEITFSKRHPSRAAQLWKEIINISSSAFRGSTSTELPLDKMKRKTETSLYNLVATLRGLRDTAFIDIYHENESQYPLMIHPNSLFRRCWDFITALMVTYVCIMVPLMIGFEFKDFGTFFTHFESLLDIYFILDIFLNFRTGIVLNGEIIMNPRTVALTYARTWLLMDFMSSVPISWFFSKTHQKSLKIIKMQKIPKLLRVGRLLKYLRQMARYYSFVISVIATFLVIHIDTCLWILFNHECFDGETNICQDENEEPMAPMYLEAFHSIILMFFGISEYSNFKQVSKLKSPIEQADSYTYLFSTITMILGTFFSSLMLGNAMSILLSWDQQEANFRSQMDLLRAEMRYYNLPNELQHRVKRNYDYLWLNQRSYTDIRLLNQPGLSKSLRTNIALHLYKDLLRKVPFFMGTSSKFLGKVCLALKTAVFLPGDIVIYEGDVGREMFIIRKGSVEIILRLKLGTSDKIILGDGTFFGETALVMEVRRTNTVRAVSVCDLNVLDKRAFDEILAEYPEFGEKLKKLVVQRQLDNMNIESQEVKKVIETKLKHVVDKSLRRRRMSQSLRVVYNAKRIADKLAEITEMKTAIRRMSTEVIKSVEGLQPPEPKSRRLSDVSEDEDDMDSDDTDYEDKVFKRSKMSSINRKMTSLNNEIMAIRQDVGQVLRANGKTNSNMKSASTEEIENTLDNPEVQEATATATEIATETPPTVEPEPKKDDKTREIVPTSPSPDHLPAMEDRRGSTKVE